MSAAVALGADIPAGDLEGLRRAVCKRAAWEVYHHHDDRDHVFPAVSARIQQARQGRTEAGRIITTEADMIRLFSDLEADLRGLLTLPVAEFRRCVESKATNPRGFNAQHVAQADMQARMTALAPALPRVQPGELLARLASAGMIVEAVEGNLHVRPAELLSEADRAALIANKAALVEALNRAAVVL